MHRTGEGADWCQLQEVMIDRLCAQVGTEIICADGNERRGRGESNSIVCFCDDIDEDAVNKWRVVRLEQLRTSGGSQ